MNTKIYTSVQSIERCLNKTTRCKTLKEESSDTKVEFILSQLQAVDYTTLTREEKGTVREFLQKQTGYSRSQIARNIQLYRSQYRMQEPKVQRNATPKLVAIGATVAAILFALSLNQGSSSSQTASVTGALDFGSSSSADELILNDANQEVFNVRRSITSEKPLVTTRAFVSLRSDESGTIVADPLFIAQDTVEQTGERSATRNRVLATSVEELQERVEERKVKRQRFWNNFSFNSNNEQHNAADDAPAVLTADSTLDEIRAFIRNQPKAQAGQVLTLEGGVPVWRDIHEMIRPGGGRVPREIHGGHGSAGSQTTTITRRGGGGSGGGGSTTNVTNVTQVVSGGSSEWDSSTGLVFLATSSDFVGIGTSTPETALEVVGTASASTLAASNLINCTSLKTDANGNITCGSGSGGSGNSVFVGTTSVTTYDGSFSDSGDIGYEAANNICAAEFSGSHFCQVDEIIGTIASEDIDTLFVGVPDAWVAEGAPGFTADSNDCRGWTANNATYLGAWWDFDVNGGGIGYLTNCSTTKPLSCCR